METVTLSKRRARARPVGQRQRPQTSPQPLQIKHVLVPIDFSPPSLEAIGFVLPWLRRFGAELHLVHVVPPDYLISGLAAMPLAVSEVQVEAKVRRHLKDVAKKFSIELRKPNIHALRGRAFEQICQLAREVEIDLIVMPTRGNTGLKHLALGSTAERVVRYAPCPVLVLHGAAAKTQKGGRGRVQVAPSFRKILVPIDFSPASMEGLSCAKKLAKEFQAALILLHSVHVQYYFTSDEYARYDFPQVMQEAEKLARQQLRDLIRKTDLEGVEVKGSLQLGHAGDQICTGARNLGADLIVTSSHGSTRAKRVLLGSTSEYVVRHAGCPVLVVPSRERPTPAPAQKK